MNRPLLSRVGSGFALSFVIASLASFIPLFPARAVITDQDLEAQDAYRNRVCCDCTYTASGASSASHLYLTRQDSCSDICAIDSDQTAHPGITMGPLTCSVVQTGCTSRTDLDSQHTCPAAPVSAPATEAPRPFQSLNPNPAFPIPGVEFTPAVQNGSEVAVPFLAQYIGGIFRFMIGLGSIAASAMIVYGGFRYLMAASLPDVKDGKETIKDAILGLVVLLGSYVILQTINPELLNLRPLSLNVVQSEQIRTADNTGDPNASTNPDDYGGPFSLDQAACGAGRTENHFGRDFYILPLRRGGYYQGQTPWGPIAYGPNLNETPSQSNTPCGPGGQSSACVGTIGQGGCGVTSVATIAAFYGVTVSDDKANELADNTMIWAGSGSSRTLQPLSQANPRLATQLRARSQPHLFDPLDAAKLASRPGGGRVVNGGTQNLHFVQWIPGGFTVHSLTPGANRAAEAKRLIESGQPLLFHCSHCHMNELVHTNDPAGGFTEGSDGHFMVLYGVSRDGQHFLIHDVGWSNDSPRKGFTLSAQEINTAPGSRLTIWDMHPADRTIQNCGNPTGGGTTGAGGGGVTTAPSGPSTVVAGGVRVQNFTFRPTGGDDGWQENQSFMMFPNRLMSGDTALNRYPSGNPQRPRLRLYIYLHGQNDSRDSFAESLYPRYLQNALGEVAGTKNVIIAGPHYMGAPYMQRLNLSEFYSRLITQLGTVIPGFRPDDIRDVVVGGHSAATCQSPRGGPSGILLTQAITSPLPNQIGVVAYDGCNGIGGLTPSNFSQRGNYALYINTDLSGMGVDVDVPASDPARRNRYAAVQRLWDLPTTSNCPAYISSLGRQITCYGKTTPQGEIMQFQTRAGHRQSVELMTKIMLRAFYGS